MVASISAMPIHPWAIHLREMRPSVAVKKTMMNALHQEPALSEMFVAYLLALEYPLLEDLVDQLFNSSERRLARVLLLLAHFGKEGIPHKQPGNLGRDDWGQLVRVSASL